MRPDEHNDLYNQLTERILIDALGDWKGFDGWNGPSGVREPRRPLPFNGAGAVSLPIGASLAR